MLHIAICDDDAIFIEQYKELLIRGFEKYPFIHYKLHIIHGNEQECIDLIEKNTIDLLFLDIQLPKMSGKEVARRIRLRDKKISLVFLTSLDSEMLDTYQYDVFDYIPKYLMEERMGNTIARFVEKHIQEGHKKEQFQVHNKTIYLDFMEIVYFETINKKVYIHQFKGEPLLTKMKYEEVKKKYCKLGFLDIHRTCIVNPRYIYLIREQEVELDNGSVLPLSRRKRSSVITALAQMLLGEEEG